MTDIFLELVVAMIDANEPGTDGPDVSLIVGGFLISGRLISKKEYFEHTKITKYLHDMTTKQLADMPADNESTGQVPEFIHLKGARYFAGGAQRPIPENGGVHVRIRLDQVAGFHFGLLATTEQ